MISTQERDQQDLEDPTRYQPEIGGKGGVEGANGQDRDRHRPAALTDPLAPSGRLVGSGLRGMLHIAPGRPRTITPIAAGAPRRTLAWIGLSGGGLCGRLAGLCAG
jgi:hypothetical protein